MAHRNPGGDGHSSSDDSGSSSNNQRRKCQRWIHAGVARDPKGNRVQMWFGFTNSRYQNAFTEARIEERGWHIHYAINGNGDLSGNRGVGQIQRNLITFNDHIASRWRRYLTRNGQWRENKATKGRAKQRDTLLEIWKDVNYHDPYPNGNHGLLVGPSLNAIHPEGGIDDNPPYHAFDRNVRCYPNSRIPLSPAHIKFQAFTDWDASPYIVIKEFLRGRMARAVGQANVPGFEALQVERIESAFFYCGWRVDLRAVKKANKHVRENRVRLANNSRSWRRHRPIKVDPEQPRCYDIEALMNDLRDNHYEQHDYGGDDSSDDDDYPAHDGGPNGGQDGGDNDSDSSDPSSDDSDEAPRPSRLKSSQVSQRNKASTAKTSNAKAKATTARAATTRVATAKPAAAAAKTANGKGAKKAKDSGKNGGKDNKPQRPAKAKVNAKGKGSEKKGNKLSQKAVSVSDSETDDDELSLSSYDENDDDDNHVLILDASSEEDADDEDDNDIDIIENRVINNVGGSLQQAQQPRVPLLEDETLFVSSDDDQPIFIEMRPVQSKLGGSDVRSLKKIYFEQSKSAAPVKSEGSQSQINSPERQSPSASSAVVKRSTSAASSNEAQRGSSQSSSSHGFQDATTDMLGVFGIPESGQRSSPNRSPAGKRMSEEMEGAEETAEPQSPHKKAKGDVKEEPIVIKDEINGELIDLLSDDEHEEHGDHEIEGSKMVIDLDMDGNGTADDPFTL